MIVRLFSALAAVALCGGIGTAQPQSPQPWWPTQPQSLPFLHPLFSSDAVLQRDVAAPVWGWSTPGDRIRISVDGKPTGEVAVAAANGRWQTRIGPFAAGGPHTIKVEGGSRKAELANILFGDVWLCAGQSNMNWAVRSSTNGEAEAKRADHPGIRSFTVGFHPALVPQAVPQPARWEVCNPTTARNFTGVGYFFARHIHETQKVPVGIIHASVGATAAEAWTSGVALRRHMPFDFRDRLAELDKSVAAAGPDYDYFRAVEKWVGAVDPVGAKKRYSSDPELDTGDWVDIAVPKPWQEAGLKDFDGMVWFRRSIELPESWTGKDLRIALSTIRDADVVWFNGTLIGATQTPGTARSYRVDGKLVQPGKNLLVAAVMNRTGPGGFCSAPGQMLVHRADEPIAKPIALSGTWKAKAAVKAGDLTTPPPTPLAGNYKTITSLDNGMIAPLVPFALKGVAWYQGESNWPYGPQYRRLLPTLIADWRERFGVGEFPFLIVSLANYNPLQTKPVEPGWAELREAQWRTARKVPNTGLAVTIDIGDANDIHPRNKQEVGRRLGLVARRLTYGEKELIASGPEFDEMMIEKSAIRLYFKHVGGGLTTPAGGKLNGFAIAGVDKQFVWADAAIDGGTIVVSSTSVAEPTHVRYGWASNPVVNLFNKEGLPAIPFRTDE